MRKVRRKALVQALEKVALGLVLLDVSVYFAVSRPLGNLLSSEQSRYNVVRERVQNLRLKVARLEGSQASLPEAKDQIKVFERKYVPPRRRGFSRAARLIRQLTDQSGIELSNVAYKLDSNQDDPLRRLGIEVSVAGPFPSLMNFTHALETASDFIVVRDFTFEHAEGNVVELRLEADLYLTP